MWRDEYTKEKNSRSKKAEVMNVVVIRTKVITSISKLLIKAILLPINIASVTKVLIGRLFLQKISAPLMRADLGNAYRLINK